MDDSAHSGVTWWIAAFELLLQFARNPFGDGTDRIRCKGEFPWRDGVASVRKANDEDIWFVWPSGDVDENTGDFPTGKNDELPDVVTARDGRCFGNMLDKELDQIWGKNGSGEADQLEECFPQRERLAEIPFADETVEGTRKSDNIGIIPDIFLVNAERIPRAVHGFMVQEDDLPDGAGELTIEFDEFKTKGRMLFPESVFFLGAELLLVNHLPGEFETSDVMEECTYPDLFDESVFKTMFESDEHGEDCGMQGMSKKTMGDRLWRNKFRGEDLSGGEVFENQINKEMDAGGLDKCALPDAAGHLGENILGECEDFFVKKIGFDC